MLEKIRAQHTLNTVYVAAADCLSVAALFFWRKGGGLPRGEDTKQGDIPARQCTEKAAHLLTKRAAVLSERFTNEMS